MARNPSRPLSPHLSIWRWGPHMLVSILHRVTGGVLTIAGLALLTWWLIAIATGAEAYDRFSASAMHPLGLVVMIGLSWAFFQHSFSGLRHLFMDIGAGFELGVNKRAAVTTIAASLIATAALWVYLLGAAR
ncbi:MAG: succinate dehydrogenase, cytochrome b556 subunit [Pseudomonadota bacterium]|nr:succinate dehydrogenase, cytochrome b556 subunit [Pseudomonadota bacterium]